MAATKKTAKKTQATPKTKSNPLYSIYGARMSKSGERVNISILTGKDEIQWATISINPETSRSVKVTKITDIDVTLKIPRVDIAEDDEEEEEDDEE